VSTDVELMMLTTVLSH